MEDEDIDMMHDLPDDQLQEVQGAMAEDEAPTGDA